jgi:hypothetical protein
MESKGYKSVLSGLANKKIEGIETTGRIGGYLMAFRMAIGTFHLRVFIDLLDGSAVSPADTFLGTPSFTFPRDILLMKSTRSASLLSTPC